MYFWIHRECGDFFYKFLYTLVFKVELLLIKYICSKDLGVNQP